ncbi:hypothetical protein F5Y16DRAFT_160160 [Xylariaceae sp. FL0255]|nr:hypothetical protein F5Y16DRAFT_160160 [Xylariaceae sp. FL0255]
MDSSSSASSQVTQFQVFCVNSRCGLCRFDLNGNEDVIISKCADIDRDSDSGSDGDVFHLCGSEHPHRDQHLIICHAQCISPPIPSLFEATTYSYEPWPNESLRRARWICSGLASMIYMALSSTLPYEICSMIACYCLRQHAAQDMIRFCRENSAVDFRVDLSRPVWARYALLDGLAYIVTLTNGPAQTSDVLITLPTESLKTIFVGEDHLGVREIHFTGTSTKAPGQYKQGLWWRTCQAKGLELEGRTDGHKLRRLLCAKSHRDKNDEDVIWSTPTHFTERFCLTTFFERSGPLKMNHKLLQLCSGVSGYSFYLKRGIVSMKHIFK